MATIAKALEASDDQVARVLGRIKFGQTYKSKAEKKEVGSQTHWRIFPFKEALNTSELALKLRPLLKELEKEGRKNMATMSRRRFFTSPARS